MAEHQAELETDRGAMPVDHEESPRLAFPVVGIGASAGGLEAFSEFFKAMRADSGMAFVLIQHLPPDRESMIAEILSRHTKMPVRQVEDKMPVDPNSVYVIRPGRTLSIKEGVLHLGERLDRPGNNRPVDDFFKSLAEEQRERSICIILSGMGSNGTAGAQAVKAVGGLCIAQDPDGAQFPSMPRHLIDAGYADYVLTLKEMPAVLQEYIAQPYVRGGEERSNPRNDQQHLREILAILRTRTRHDFTGYKKPTVMRRIQRRLGLNHMSKLGDYARLLRQSTIEVTALSDDLLIHVTGFFRDSAAWESLRQNVIVPLIASRDANAQIRCWVTACSSGEEAYSLAMLLIEESERTRKPLDIKVFATDTAERTLASARGGVYPGGIEAEISPERLERFFQREDAVYRIRAEVRQMVVFAPQNILQDPPFSRLDIATCRNLLIYLEPAVQKKLLMVLHFGLRQGGALFLGTSETVGDDTELFEVVDKKSRIYRRIGPARHGSLDFPLPRAGSGSEALRGMGKPTMAQLTNAALLARHVPAAVTVDRDLRIVYFHGNTRDFFEQPTGEPSRDILTIALESVRGAIRAALQGAMADNRVVAVMDGWVGEGENRKRIVITAAPLDLKAVSNYFVVSFDERAEPAQLKNVAKEAADSEAATTGELQRVRDELQSTIEELQTSNEEHKASAEEVMSMNEEMQSTNEELETSREEMQSLNEELTTVNAQLQAKVEEYQSMSSDLSSLLSSTAIAVLFLDPRFCIHRFTPAVRDLVEVIASDIGRPISDLAWKFSDADLMNDAISVIEKLVPQEREILAENGRWYLRRVLPYRTADNRIDGLVITFVDITERRKMEAALGEKARLLDLSNDVIIVRDVQNRIIYWNTGASELYGWSAEEARGKDVQKLLQTEGEEPIGVLIEQLRTSERLIGEVVQKTRAGRSITILCRWALDQNVRGEPVAVLMTATDISNRKVNERTLLESKQAAESANQLKDEFLATVSHELQTPLSAILLWSKLLGGPAINQEQITEGLSAITSSAEAQKTLIEDLLDVSRIISGKLRLKLEEVDLALLVQEAVDAILPAARAKGIVINLDLRSDIGVVMVDSDRIRQVIWNLLTNAVKFSPEGAKIAVGLSRRGNTVEIRISDTGQGISALFLPHVFDRFRQGDASSTRHHGGLGLGLDISKQLVELHGGTIEALSGGAGMGSAFVIRLPLRRIRAAGVDSGPEVAQAHVDLTGIQVLLVEDDGPTRNALAIALRGVGAEAVAVASAADAMEAFITRMPDVIVSDIGLPEKDGYSLIRSVREVEKQNSGGMVPALALSAFSRDEDRARAIGAGFQSFLAKPIDSQVLVEELQALVGRGSGVSREI